MSDAELPAAARLGCKCSLAVRNMTVLDADALMRATRFTNVKLFIKPPGAPVQTRAGILEYEKNDLVKQDFALFNAGKTKICSGQLEFKIGDLGKFFGTCFGKQPIRDGGVMIGCPSDVFCSRHSVGNMRMDDGTFIGFVSVLKSAEIAKTYPGLPEKLDAAPAAQAPQEEEIND
ncbi:MAG: hypothetical protein HOK61_12575 [Alphaproteobacteria bacterium]|nr:hypothetical protein [Alphaproteobacteria bacterium]